MAVLVALLATCFIFGGASRLDVFGLIFLQPLAVIFGAIILLIPGQVHWSRVRVPMLILGLLAAAIAVQLLPLPPAIWTNLPGRAPYVDTAIVAGVAQPWRPISLTPDLTWGALVALVVPAAILVGIAAVSQRQVRQLLPFVIGGALISALIGLIQITGGSDSPFYLYRITNRGSAVGLFANRNHQAFLLAAVFPMLALWARSHVDDPRMRLARWVLAGVAILFLIPVVLVTGSRGGLMLSCLGLIFALLIFGSFAYNLERGRVRKWLLLGVCGVAVGGGGVAATAVMVSRDEALQRLLTDAVSEDARASYLPTLLRMASEFFPVGSGFGSFDPVFRMYEPFETLEINYFNHAHNDALEMLITGGVAGGLVVAVFLFWLIYRTLHILINRTHTEGWAYALTGLGVIVLLLIGSLFDYPLRTPLLAAILAIACAWAGIRTSEAERSEGSADPTKRLYGRRNHGY